MPNLKRHKLSTGYSRKGCSLCKKSHVKCDEKLPTCTRCIKRNTDCVYVTQFFTETPADKEKSQERKLGEEKSSQSPDKPKNISLESQESFISVNVSVPLLKEEQNSIDVPFMEKNTIPMIEPLVPDTFVPEFPETFDHSIKSHRLHRSSFPASISEASDVSPFSFSNISLSDLISVQNKDLKSLRALNKEYETMVYLYNEENHPDLHLFEIPWDGGPMAYFKDLMQQHDPLMKDENVSLTDQNMINFIWTLTRLTKLFYTFVLFSETTLMKVLDICFKLGTKSSIFQSVLAYHCSLHVARMYKEGNSPDAAMLWDEKVRIPAFKQCIDYLKDRLEHTDTFADIITLTFAVLIIFSGNASDKSWKAHLSGSYQLICKCISLRNTADVNDVYDAAAIHLYDIIIQWYDHTSNMATISSLSGFTHKNIMSVLRANKQIIHIQQTGEKPSTNIAIAENNINLMAGHCNEISEIIAGISRFVETMQIKREVPLSGLNFVTFLLSEESKDELLMREIHLFGEKMLEKVEIAMNNYKYERLELEDFRMDLTMRYCNTLNFYGIKLYLTFFCKGNRDSKLLTGLLRDILDLVYSMPYRSSCAMICNWSIYITGLVALLIDSHEIYDHVLGILRVFQLNGMDIPSYGILERTKMVLENKTTWELLSPENDLVIY